MLAALHSRYREAEIPPVLPGYKQPIHPWKLMLRNRGLGLVLVIYALLLGILVAILPISLYMYLAIPLIVLTLLVIWTLPDHGSFPRNKIVFLFWSFYVALLMWPNYLAIALPGLPWITVQRFVLFPLAFSFVVSLSVSLELRAEIKKALAGSKLLTRLIVAFVAIQVVTTFFSPSLGTSFQRLISNQLVWTMIFFLSVWIFSEGNSPEKWLRLTIVMTVAISIIAIFEYRQSAVLWAGHVPSFLAVNDPRVEAILAGKMRAGTTVYRTQSTLVSALNLAELLGLATALIVHAAVITKSIVKRMLLVAYLPLHFWVIVTTDSRLGLIAFFGSILGYMLLEAVRRWRLGGARLFSIATAVGYPIIIGAFFATSIFWYRLHVMVWGGGQQGPSTEARRMQWQMFWPKLGSWPFGRGPGSSGDVLGYTNPEGVLTVDSYFITLALEYGVLGFVCYISIMAVASGLAALSGINAKDQQQRMMIPASIILANFIVIKGVLSQENEHALIFMVLGLVVALRARAKAATESGAIRVVGVA